MLRPEVPGGPPEAWLKFHAQEVPDFPIHTVPDLAHQFALGVANSKVGLQRDWLVELEAGPGERDVFQISHSFAKAPGFVLPLNIHHIRT